MAPVTSAPVLLLAGHGERGGAASNARLAAIAAKVRERLPDWDVRFGVLSGAPSIEEALSGAGGRPVLVWPFFMCRGYFVDTKLRSRLDACGVTYRLLAELGAAPAFVATARRMLADAAADAARPVLVIAHGSGRGSQSRLATRQFARSLAEIGRYGDVMTAFLEEPPFARDEIDGLPAGAAVVSLFAGDGLHGGQDVDALIAESGREDLIIVCPAADIDAVAGIVADSAVGAIAGIRA